MSGLLSIAPQIETVEILGSKIPVPGVSLRGVAALLARFPELRALLTGNADRIKPEDLAAKAPEAVAAIIAAGLGYPDDEAQEDAAERLPIEAQADLLAAILKVTLPNGLASFAEKLTKLGSTLNKDAPATAPATSSPKRRKS